MKRPREEICCVACMDRDATISQRECGHVALCTGCAFRVFAKERRCPLCRTDMLTPLSVAGEDDSIPSTVFESALHYAAEIRSRGGCNLTNARALMGLFEDAPTELKHPILEEILLACSESRPPIDKGPFLTRALRSGIECEHVVSSVVTELISIRDVGASGIDALLSAMAAHPENVLINWSGCRVLWGIAYSPEGAAELAKTSAIQQVYEIMRSHTSEEVLMSACAVILNMMINNPSHINEVQNCVDPVLCILTKGKYAMPWAIRTIFVLSRGCTPSPVTDASWCTAREQIQEILRKKGMMKLECSKIIDNIDSRHLCCA